MQQSFSQVYSHYYDLIYKGKDYLKEVLQVIKLIKLYHSDAKTILNVGCGTGNHDIEFASKGYEITGIDSSRHMLNEAVRKVKAQGLAIRFLNKDICRDSINGTYDVVLSLFHVVSYLTKEEELKLAFANIYKILEPSGLFIFDFWYAPGILNNLPEQRTKLIEDGDVYIERRSFPEINFDSNIVEVKFTLGVKKSTSEEIEMSSEVHKVRYFFLEEIEEVLKTTGFKVIGTGSDYRMAGFKKEDRYATVIAQK
jgi:SAM-dependent methyltransferase